MTEKYLAIKYFEHMVCTYIFIGIVIVMVVILLIGYLIDFIERHKKGKKHGNRM